MDEFKLSKMQVLKEFYLREIPLIIYRMRMQRDNEKLGKYYDTLMNIKIATATAGMIPSIELITDLEQKTQQAIDRLLPKEPDKEAEDPYKKLERLQSIIGNVQQKKRKG
jgi:hypothetical protein